MNPPIITDRPLGREGLKALVSTLKRQGRIVQSASELPKQSYEGLRSVQLGKPRPVQ